MYVALLGVFLFYLFVPLLDLVRGSWSLADKINSVIQFSQSVSQSIVLNSHSRLFAVLL